MRIGIVGNGVVGHATARSLMEYAEVRCYDKVKERCTHSIDDVLDCDLIFVCLPTPARIDGKGCDISALESFFQEYSLTIGSERNFVLKSTVPIGTTRNLSNKYNIRNICHSPEFLTARCAVTDAQIPARNIIGCVQNGSKWRERTYADAALENLYKERFPGIPVFLMTSDESEAVKLIQNSFFGVKISFWNEVRILTDKLGLDWNTVQDAILADGRIAHSHCKVPGPDGKRGFGGACLVKDLNNLIWCFHEVKELCPVLFAAQQRNMSIRGVE